MSEDHFYHLDQLHTSDRLWVGDKAFYLGLLQQKGYPVLPGVVVSPILLQLFLEQTEWSEPMFADLPHSSLYVDVDNPRQLQAVAQQIRQALQAASFPDQWADQLLALIQPWSTSAVILRPSIALPSGFDPTVSLKTSSLLEAKVCWVNKTSIAESLKQVWAELFRARSLLYWQRLRIQLQHVHLAVLIQPIHSAIASGDAQIHPSDLNIRAVWGLGRALVNGEVAPDCYHLDLQTGEQSYQVAHKIYAYRIHADDAMPLDLSAASRSESSCYWIEPIESSQQTQPVLSPDHLQQLLLLSQRLATDLGTHLRMEWMLGPAGPSPQLYLTQVTPHLNQGRWETLDRSPQLGETKLGETRLEVEKVPRVSPVDQPVQPVVLPIATGLAAAPGQVVAPAWVSQQASLPQPIPPGSILVASHITPDWLPLLKQAAGIITEQGGMTSHAAVLARELGLPAITGVLNATQQIRTGDWLHMDGDRGEILPIAEVVQSDSVVTDPTVTDPAMLHLRFHQPSQFTEHFRLNQVLTADTASILLDSSIASTQLFVSLSQPASIARAANLPVDGVGLLRSELMLLDVLQQHHPTSWLEPNQQADLIQSLAQPLQAFAQAFAPRPVFYRSADLRPDEFSHLIDPDRPPESNPALGLRGSLRYQTEPGLFDIELAALRQVQQQGYTNLHLILPFVRTVEEFTFCRQRVEQAGLRQNPHFQLWIMAEVPSVLLLLPDYIAAGVEGVAIGSNDLTQLLLGVDRNQPQLASAFNQRHPAVLRAMHQIIQTAKQAGIPCSVCGQAPTQYPEIINLLVRWGVTAISVDLNEVAATREAIVRAEQRLLLEMARQRLNS
ncbi:putative PEP-binding protein [Thermocoleostomius sinensis]|uniref:Phosphoenolpyruvate synthase n=1 Tax=Thermocoleostomius sinensis A174 TaxID=2016057 RepID=A0A9E9C9I0_9CYAN|nr:putative PEP-binding protein [Thermocoleostomius sinensis]WAL62734.1 PEP-utilizing enzyme [Thermocoleostomius sinensis A174]